MKLEELKNKKILILGYGKEGRATEQYLKEKLPGVVFGIADQIRDPNYLASQKDYDIAIRTPGIPKSLVTIPYTTATNIFFANCTGVTIGVTGSKGKSTTASLIHHILETSGKKSHLIGNIGNPMLLELLMPYTADEIYVIELSSYQTEDLNFSPHISVITSLFPEHMDYHGSVEQYYQAKHNLITHTNPDDYYIYNPRYEILHQWAKDAHCRPIQIRTEHHIKNNPLLGEHNHANAMLAASTCHLFGLTDVEIEAAILTFKPLAHRLELVGTFHAVTFYDDAISTAPESTIEALKSLPSVGTLILGGEDRGYDFKDLVNAILFFKIPNIVLFPESGNKIEEILKNKTDMLPTIFKTVSMEEAVQFAYKNTPLGSICLLSTASPSYSLWKNFEEKGAEFQKCVRKLGNST